MIENWCQIDGYNGIYEVSSSGYVRNTKSGRILKFFMRGRYPTLTLYSNGKAKFISAHRLVLTAFVGPCPEGHVGAHIDGNSTNNELSNLAWVTPKENERHKFIHGRRARGARSSQARFSDLQASIIREAYSLGLEIHKISLLTGVGTSTIRKIVIGKSYPQAKDELRERVAKLEELATGAVFHFFCCGDGVCTDDHCGQLVPAMADLAKSISFSSDPATNAEIAAVPVSSAVAAISSSDLEKQP